MQLKSLFFFIFLWFAVGIKAQSQPSFPSIFKELHAVHGQNRQAVLEERITNWLENFSDRPALLTARSKSLLQLLEAKGYFKAATYLSEQLLAQDRCKFDLDLQRKITHYSTVKEGTTAPVYTLNAPQALKINFPKDGIKRGKILLFFWSSACGHCQRELPKVAALHKQLQQQQITLLSISLDRDKTAFRSTAEQYDWAHYSDFESWDSPVAQAFKVFATPSFFLLDGTHLEREFISTAQLVNYLNVETNANSVGLETIDLEFIDGFVPTGIGIGTPSPDQLLSVNGNASKAGEGSWASFSDQRVKKNIRTYEKGLDEILQIKPVIFNYTKKSGYQDTSKDYVGVIAQDIEQVLPSTVSVFDDSKGPSGLSDKKQFESSEILWTLVNAIKELEAKNEQLRQRINALEGKKE